jgi:hypothetical protein
MTSAKQSGLLFDVARWKIPTLCPINLCFRRLHLTFFKHDKGLLKSTSKIATKSEETYNVKWFTKTRFINW